MIPSTRNEKNTFQALPPILPQEAQKNGAFTLKPHLNNSSLTFCLKAWPPEAQITTFGAKGLFTLSITIIFSSLLSYLTGILPSFFTKQTQWEIISSHANVQWIKGTSGQAEGYVAHPVASWPWLISSAKSQSLNPHSTKLKH